MVKKNFGYYTMNATAENRGLRSRAETGWEMASPEWPD